MWTERKGVYTVFNPDGETQITWARPFDQSNHVISPDLIRAVKPILVIYTRAVRRTHAVPHSRVWYKSTSVPFHIHESFLFFEWSPGPRPSPVFRSAICDCLSLNVSVICVNPGLRNLLISPGFRLNGVSILCSIEPGHSIDTQLSRPSRMCLPARGGRRSSCLDGTVFLTTNNVWPHCVCSVVTPLLRGLFSPI